MNTAQLISDANQCGRHGGDLQTWWHRNRDRIDAVRRNRPADYDGSVYVDTWRAFCRGHRQRKARLCTSAK